MTIVDATIEDLTVDPHPVLAAARRLGPVVRVPALDAWVVTDRAMAVAVMRDAERFTVDDPRFSTGRVIGPSMLSTDGDEHRRHRSPFTDWFSSSDALLALTDRMRADADRLVATFAGDGCAELRTALAAPLAAETLVHLLGLDPPGAQALLGWYRRIVDTVQTITAGATPSPAGAEAYAELRRAILDATDAGRAAALLEAHGHLGDDDLAANASVILFGGIETSEGATANAIWHLLTDPATLRAVTDDRSLVPAFVEETLRLEPAATNVDRYATTDVTIGDAAIRPGDYVVVSLAAANRDPAVFPDPDAIRLDRRNGRQHTTFALGPHACLGIHIARAQTIAALDALLTRLPDMTLDPDASEPPHGLVFRKPPAVTARWSVR
ncbi:MAG: cytochrome P450 [Actinomycetota bacterium]